MANLFVVFTPFQFFVAQQLVAQEQLKDCVLIESFVHGNPQFIDIYDMMEIEGMWLKKIVYPDFTYWDGARIKSPKDAIEVYKNYKGILKILQENKVKDIFLGEYQNTCYQFTCVLFSHLGYKVSFFEEGSAHYVQRYTPKESIYIKTKAFIRDLVYYLPIYHVRFGIWRYVPNRPVTKGLPIYRRYSFIPKFHESFDCTLEPQNLISTKLSRYMSETIDSTDTNRVLFMTDPLAEIIGKENINVYFDVVSECFSQMDKRAKVYIKYHPRDPKEYQMKIVELAEKYELHYAVLSSAVNIPVEYYLQQYKFDKVYIFNASTYVYSGYLFPECEFVKLIPAIYAKTKSMPKMERANYSLRMFIDLMQ